MKKVIFFVLYIFIMYLLCAFICMSIDATKWGIGVRAAFVFITGLIGSALAANKNYL